MGTIHSHLSHPQPWEPSIAMGTMLSHVNHLLQCGTIHSHGGHSQPSETSTAMGTIHSHGNHAQQWDQWEPSAAMGTIHSHGSHPQPSEPSKSNGNHSLAVGTTHSHGTIRSRGNHPQLRICNAAACMSALKRGHQTWRREQKGKD
jgi:hypothetical protein